MKKLLLLTCILASTFFYTKATHLMGGEITAKQISGNDYEVCLTLYRDTLGIPITLSAHFEVRDLSGILYGTFQIPYDTFHVLTNIAYGVEIYNYKDTVTLPVDTFPNAQGAFKISFSNCCRNNAILNLQPGNMYLTTTLTLDSNAANSTPYFMAPPIVQANVGTPLQYNPLPIDPDGDSLVWSIDTPLQSRTAYSANYITPADTLNGALSIDPLTGQISWTPKTMGNYVISILVEEYRNGVKIGEIRRDMQFVVTQIVNFMPRINNLGSTIPPDPNGHYKIPFNKNNFHALKFTAQDQDPNDVIQFAAFGEPFILATNPATFTSTPTGNGNEVEGTFSWTPDNSAVRAKPYAVVFRLYDGSFAFDETVLIEVVSSTGIDGVEKPQLKFVYPNPINSNVFIPLNLTNAGEVQIDIFNLLGEKVQSFGKMNYDAGNHIIQKNIDLPTGNYIINVSQNGQVIGNQQISVSK